MALFALTEDLSCCASPRNVEPEGLLAVRDSDGGYLASLFPSTLCDRGTGKLEQHSNASMVGGDASMTKHSADRVEAPKCDRPAAPASFAASP